LLVADDSDDSDGDGEYYVSVHELSVQLWRSFDTPRVSVQKKIQDVGIPLLQCNRSQLDLLRREGIVQGYRATIVSIQNAERLCDALQHSREKRGLVKHPLKEKEKPGKKRKRREEAWLVRMNAKIGKGKRKSRAKKKIVDGCALIRSSTTPTHVNWPAGTLTPGSSSLEVKQVSVGEKTLASQILNLKSNQHEIVKNLNQFAVLSRGLEALDLNTGHMATLRSYLLNKNGTESLQDSKQISRSAISLTRGRPSKRGALSDLPGLPLKRPRLHSAANTTSSLDSTHTDRLMSPPAFQGCSPELQNVEHTVNGHESCIVSTPERADRFELCWSDEETDHTKLQGGDDVILVKVENRLQPKSGK
jgi:hypothetical protein